MLRVGKLGKLGRGLVSGRRAHAGNKRTDVGILMLARKEQWWGWKKGRARTPTESFPHHAFGLTPPLPSPNLAPERPHFVVRTDAGAPRKLRRMISTSGLRSANDCTRLRRWRRWNASRRLWGFHPTKTVSRRAVKYSSNDEEIRKMSNSRRTSLTAARGVGAPEWCCRTRRAWIGGGTGMRESRTCNFDQDSQQRSSGREEGWQ